MIAVANDDIAQPHGNPDSARALDLGATDLDGVVVAQILLDRGGEPWRHDIEIDRPGAKPQPKTAKPDTEHYGRLSVLTQWRATAKIQFDVSRSAFVPPPKITSSIVRIEPLAKPVAEARLADLERITAAAFGQRRKMLRQSLKTLSQDAENLVKQAGLDPTARAETLSVSDFAALARTFFP